MNKIIIDCDPGIDDALALSLAINSSEYDILGITLVSGNVEATLCYKNALKILNFEQTSIPIYIGEEIPLKRKLVTAKETHGEDGLGNSNLFYENIPAKYKGVDFILDSLKKEKNIKIFALGPLTNIATALKKDRNAFKDCELICMGGAFKSHGNSSPVAEFNFWVDPDAADYVIKNFPGMVKIIPLDVTREFVITPNTISFLKHLDKKRADFIESITDFYMDFHYEYEDIIGCVINDPLTFISDLREDLFEKKEYYCEVATTGAAMGELIVDEYNFYKKEKNVVLYTSICSESAMKEFLIRLFKGHEKEILARGSLK